MSHAVLMIAISLRCCQRMFQQCSLLPLLLLCHCTSSLPLCMQLHLALCSPFLTFVAPPSQHCNFFATWTNGKPWPQDICLHSFSPKHWLLACSSKVGESSVKLVTCSDTPGHQVDVRKNCKAVFCSCIPMDQWQVLDNDLAVNIKSLGGSES